MNRPLIGYLLAPTVSAAICLLVSVCTPIFALLLLDEEVQSGSAMQIKLRNRVVTYEEAERISFAKSEVIGGGSLSAKVSLACWIYFIYFAASATATLRWI
jgi:hypothetical protein